MQHATRRASLPPALATELRQAKLALEIRGAASWTRGTPMPTDATGAGSPPDALDLAMQRARRQAADLQARFGGAR